MSANWKWLDKICAEYAMTIEEKADIERLAVCIREQRAALEAIRFEAQSRHNAHGAFKDIDEIATAALNRWAKGGDRE